MVLTMFLLGLVYVVAIVVVISAGASVAAVLVIAALFFGVQLFASDKIALRAMAARPVSPADAPELHTIVDHLCMQANVPKPQVAIVESRMPNAFALGRTQKTATVCATTGLLALLSPVELEAVLAHELSHIVNHDAMVMTVASFLASISAILVRFGFIFGGGRGFGRGRNQGSLFVVVLLVSIAVYAISFVLLRALSRYREYAADRGSAIITGRPSALSSALLKITGRIDLIPTRDLRAATQMNALFIIPAGAKTAMSSVFATHPPVEKRIEALNRLEAQLQGTK